MSSDARALGQLRDVLVHGIVADIYLAERARALHRRVGEFADQVNGAGYGGLFEAVQNAAVSEVTLSIAKLYEAPSKRYPTRSVPAVIKLLGEHATELTIINKEPLLTDAARLPIAVDDLRALEGSALTAALARALERACPHPSRAEECSLSRALDALRASRDKAVAHNEAVDRETLPRAKWEAGEALLWFAKRLVGAIGIGYFGTAYLDDAGRYLRSDDAGLAARQLGKLLLQAGVVSG